MKQLLAVYDNKGETIDRYTVVFNIPQEAYYTSLSLSDDCESPQGVSMLGVAKVNMPLKDNQHLGGLVLFMDLPVNVQNHVKKVMS